MKLDIKQNPPLAIQLSFTALLSSCVMAADSAEIEDKSKGRANTPTARNEATRIPEINRMTNDERIIFTKKDLAKKLDVNEMEIMLLSSQNVTWRSGALGCPKPGVQYTQALQAGTLIVLRAHGKHYRYHAARNGIPKYCPNERAQTPAANQSDI